MKTKSKMRAAKTSEKQKKVSENTGKTPLTNRAELIADYKRIKGKLAYPSLDLAADDKAICIKRGWQF